MKAPCRACRNSLEKVDDPVPSDCVSIIGECVHSKARDVRISTVLLQRCRSAITITRVAFAIGKTEAHSAMMRRSDGLERTLAGTQRKVGNLVLESDHAWRLTPRYAKLTR